MRRPDRPKPAAVAGFRVVVYPRLDLGDKRCRFRSAARIVDWWLLGSLDHLGRSGFLQRLGLGSLCIAGSGYDLDLGHTPDVPKGPILVVWFRGTDPIWAGGDGGRKSGFGALSF